MEAQLLGAFGGLFLVLLFVVALILTVAFICLPFIVMGTNKRLDKLIEESKTNNAALLAIGKQLDYIAKKGPAEARPKVEEKR